LKIANNNKTFEGGVEELDKFLSTTITTENDLELFVDTFAKVL
jgi:hypothetical protein